MRVLSFELCKDAASPEKMNALVLDLLVVANDRRVGRDKVPLLEPCQGASPHIRTVFLKCLNDCAEAHVHAVQVGSYCRAMSSSPLRPGL